MILSTTQRTSCKSVDVIAPFCRSAYGFDVSFVFEILFRFFRKAGIILLTNDNKNKNTMLWNEVVFGTFVDLKASRIHLKHKYQFNK